MAAAAERAIWGVGSTIATVTTLWRAVVDTGALVIWSRASVNARTCWVTVRGGGCGHDWDENAAGGGVAGAVGVVCGVHGRSTVEWVSGGMQRRGLVPRAFYVSRAMGDLWPHPHMTGSGKKG